MLDAMLDVTSEAAPLIEVRGLTKVFSGSGALFGRQSRGVHALSDVSFDVRAGEVLAMVGESGSGKTTVGRLLLRLVEPSGGAIRFDGQDLLALSKRDLRAFRRRMQIVFQDPFSSLNPYATVGACLSEVLTINAPELSADDRRRRVEELLSLVGLLPVHASRFPHEFSGGQRQRIAIARALAARPEFIIADEPVSALDVSIQAQIINLLQDLQAEFKLTMLFISHDLAVVRHVANRVAVLYLGRIVEIAPTRALFARPLHPYSAALLAAAPKPVPGARRGREALLRGDMPSPMAPPQGCAFHTRCPFKLPVCLAERPPLLEVQPGHSRACHRGDIL
ncbi:MAG: ABC transporter ATP-binding protein [Xanthobacteraceae bacterium]